jgi:hypothetical protein
MFWETSASLVSAVSGARTSVEATHPHDGTRFQVELALKCSECLANSCQAAGDSALRQRLKECGQLQDSSFGGRKVGQDLKVSFQQSADWLVGKPDL